MTWSDLYEKMKDIENTGEFEFFLLTGIGRFVGGVVEVDDGVSETLG